MNIFYFCYLYFNLVSESFFKLYNLYISWTAYYTYILLILQFTIKYYGNYLERPSYYT